MIKVLLADDHSIVRAGLRRLIEESGDMAVIAEAADGREALRSVEKEMPDVAVVEIVRFCPIFIRDKGHKTADGPNNIVGHARTREGLVPAIVLDDENPCQEKRVHQGYGEGQQE